MNITKLPSGSYRLRQTINGRTYSVTVPYKPGKKEAFELIREKMTGANILRKTFLECAHEYIDGKKHTLSPATLRGYESMLRSIPDSFKDKEIGSLTGWDVQVMIDRMTAEGKSPKTVRNFNGFVSAVFSVFCPETIIRTQLPQKLKNERPAPSDDAVKQILDAAAGTRYEVALRLACYGLRRSEICALSADDLNGNRLMINKAIVLNSDNQWITKTTKTTASTRAVYIDDDLAELIRERGVYDGHPNNIYIYLQQVQDELGLERFSLHALRHYYATTMHSLGVPDADIMAAGGWKTDHVMKTVYRHEKDVETNQAKMIDHMTGIVTRS